MSADDKHEFLTKNLNLFKEAKNTHIEEHKNLRRKEC